MADIDKELTLLLEKMRSYDSVLEAAARKTAELTIQQRYGVAAILGSASALNRVQEAYSRGIILKSEDVRLAKIQNALSIETQRNQERVANLTKALNFAASSAASKVQMLSKSTAEATASFLQQASALTGVNVSYQGLTNSLETYRRSQIEVAVIARNYGESVSDIARAQTAASRSVVASKQAFADLNKTWKEMYLGIPPTTAAVAKFSHELQSRFGYAIETTNQKTREFLQLQNSIPQSLDMITQAQNAYRRSTTEGDKAAAGLLMTLRAMGASRQQIKDAMIMARPPDAAIQGLMTYEKTMARLKQTQQDSLLNMAQKMEPSLTKIARVVGGLADALAKIPAPALAAGTAIMAIAPAIYAVTAAMTGLKAIGPFLSMGMGKAGFAGLKAMKFASGGAIPHGASSLPVLPGGAYVVNRRMSQTYGPALDALGARTVRGHGTGDSVVMRSSGGYVALTPGEKIMPPAMAAVGYHANRGAIVNRATGGDAAAAYEKAAYSSYRGGFRARGNLGGRAMRSYGVASGIYGGAQEYLSREEDDPNRGKAAIVKGGAQAIGTIAGGALGQAIIPIPGVGAAIGGYAGGYAGGLIGDKLNAFAGMDAQSGKAPEQERIRLEILKDQNEAVLDIVQGLKLEAGALDNISQRQAQVGRPASALLNDRKEMLNLLQKEQDPLRKSEAIQKLIGAGVMTMRDLEKALNVDLKSDEEKRKAINNLIQESTKHVGGHLDRLLAVEASMTKQIAAAEKMRQVMQQIGAFAPSVGGLAEQGLAGEKETAEAYKSGMQAKRQELEQVGKQVAAAALLARSALNVDQANNPTGFDSEIQASLGKKRMVEYQAQAKQVQDLMGRQQKAQTAYNTQLEDFNNLPSEKRKEITDNVAKKGGVDSLAEAEKFLKNVTKRAEDARAKLQKSFEGDIDLLPKSLVEAAGHNLDQLKTKVDATVASIDLEISNLERQPQSEAVKQKIAEKSTQKDSMATYLSETYKYRTAYNQTLKEQAQVTTESITQPFKAELFYAKQSTDLALRRKSVAESSNLGMGASWRYTVESMKGLERQKVAVDKMAGASRERFNAEQEITGTHINENRILNDTVALSQELLAAKEAASKVGDTDKARAYQNMLTAVQARVEAENKILDINKEQLEISKNYREGWMDAMTEMVAGAGEMSALVGTSKSGVTQLIRAGAPSTFRSGGEGRGYHRTEPLRMTPMGLTGNFGQSGLGQYTNVHSGFVDNGVFGTTTTTNPAGVGWMGGQGTQNTMESEAGAARDLAGSVRGNIAANEKNTAALDRNTDAARGAVGTVRQENVGGRPANEQTPPVPTPMPNLPAGAATASISGANSGFVGVPTGPTGSAATASAAPASVGKIWAHGGFRSREEATEYENLLTLDRTVGLTPEQSKRGQELKIQAAGGLIGFRGGGIMAVKHGAVINGTQSRRHQGLINSVAKAFGASVRTVPGGPPSQGDNVAAMGPGGQMLGLQSGESIVETDNPLALKYLMAINRGEMRNSAYGGIIGAWGGWASWSDKLKKLAHDGPIDVNSLKLTPAQIEEAKIALGVKSDIGGYLERAEARAQASPFSGPGWRVGPTTPPGIVNKLSPHSAKNLKSLAELPSGEMGDIRSWSDPNAMQSVRAGNLTKEAATVTKAATKAATETVVETAIKSSVKTSMLKRAAGGLRKAGSWAWHRGLPRLGGDIGVGAIVVGTGMDPFSPYSLGDATLEGHGMSAIDPHGDGGSQAYGRELKRTNPEEYQKWMERRMRDQPGLKESMARIEQRHSVRTSLKGAAAARRQARASRGGAAPIPTLEPRARAAWESTQNVLALNPTDVEGGRKGKMGQPDVANPIRSVPIYPTPPRYANTYVNATERSLASDYATINEAPATTAAKADNEIPTATPVMSAKEQRAQEAQWRTEIRKQAKADHARLLREGPSPTLPEFLPPLPDVEDSDELINVRKRVAAESDKRIAQLRRGETPTPFEQPKADYYMSGRLRRSNVPGLEKQDQENKQIRYLDDQMGIKREPREPRVDPTTRYINYRNSPEYNHGQPGVGTYGGGITLSPEGQAEYDKSRAIVDEASRKGIEQLHQRQGLATGGLIGLRDGGRSAHGNGTGIDFLPESITHLIKGGATNKVEVTVGFKDRSSANMLTANHSVIS